MTVSRTAKMERMRKIARREDAMQRKTADHLVPFLYKNVLKFSFKSFFGQSLKNPLT